MTQSPDPNVIHLAFTMAEASILEGRLMHIELGDMHFTEVEYLVPMLKQITDAIVAYRNKHDKSSN